jgi:hypothetical protein
MNIKFLISAAVAAISISAIAQKPPTGGAGHAGAPGQHGQRGPGGPGGRMMGGNPELMKQLNITDAQKAKLKAISDKYQAKLKAAGFIRPQPGGPRPDFTKFKPIFDAQRKEMEAVYTQKQKDIIKKWRADHPRPQGGFGAPGKGGPPPGGKAGGVGHGGGH